MNKIKKFIVPMVVIMAIAIIIPVSADASYLSVGSRGTEVSKLQTWLIDNGFPIPFIQSGVASKGYFGQQTRDAVKMYQESQGVPTTGSIDSSAVTSSRTFGSVTGPDMYFPYRANNDLRIYETRRPSLLQASSTVCSIKSPIATSSLQFAAIRFRLASSSAEVIDIGKSTNPAATTTKIGTTYYVAASAQATILASTTAQAADLTIFGPLDYLVFKMDNGTGVTGNVPSGICEAQFFEI